MSYATSVGLGGAGGNIASKTQAELQAMADARVASAIAMISNDPAARAALSPLSSLAVDVGKKALQPLLDSAKKVAVDQLSNVASSIGPEALAAFNGASEIVAEIAGKVTQFLPAIQAFLSVYNGIAGMAQAAQAKQDDERCQQDLNTGVAKSGAEGTFVGSDIFLPGGSDFTGPSNYTKNESSEERLYPFSSIGRAFVGIFEWREDLLQNNFADIVLKDGSGTLPGRTFVDCYTDLECALVGDYAQYHTRAAYKRLSKFYRERTEAGKNEPNAGLMPESRMKLMKALRMAMAARSSYSPMLFSVYMDLARDCWQKGWVTGGWADFMMSHRVWPLDHDGNLIAHREYENSKRSYVVINPPRTWDNQKWGVLPDSGWKEYQLVVAKLPIAGGSIFPWMTGSRCGEGGWRALTNLALNLVISRPEVDSKKLDEDIKKARARLATVKLGNLSLPTSLVTSLSARVAAADKAKKESQARSRATTQKVAVAAGLIGSAALIGYMLAKKK